MSLPADTPNQSLRILHLVSSPTTSGPCVYVLELSQMLRQLGHQVTIVARPDSWMAAEAHRLQFETLVSDQYRFPFDEIQRLRQVVLERQIDVVHTVATTSFHEIGLARFIVRYRAVRDSTSLHRSTMPVRFANCGVSGAVT
jgi:hypothetical protein